MPDIHFGTGTVGGHFIMEQISVGSPEHSSTNGTNLIQADDDENPNEITVKNLHVGIIDRHSGIFDRFEFDAIVGMSYKYRTLGNPRGHLFPTFMDEVQS